MKTELRATLGEIVGLHNCAVADKGSIDKAGIKKIAGLHNCAVADITPQLWHDVTPQLRSSAKRKDGGTNMMITYDVTPQQRDGWPMTQPKSMALTQMGSSITPHFFIKYL